MKQPRPNVQERGLSGVETAVQGNTEFALALYQKLGTTEGKRMLTVTPASFEDVLLLALFSIRWAPPRQSKHRSS
jgi:hypothetical protein